VDKSIGRRLLFLLILLLFIFNILAVLNLSTVGVSAAEYPAVYIEPANTTDSALAKGSIYAISIKTNYTGDDINSWQFTLSYDPNILKIGIDGSNCTDIWTGGYVGGVLKRFFETTGKLIVPDSENVYVNDILMIKPDNYTINYQTGMIMFTTAPGNGVQVKATYLYCLINGDLITKDKDPNAMFNPGTYNNTAGRLELTGALLFYIFPPAPLTSGPGTLANVTFAVVGVGESNIILGLETKLIGMIAPDYEDPYNIVDGATMPDHLGHGYFNNIPPETHDVAITSLNAPAETPLGDPVSINITVANEGSFNESVTVTVSYNSTEIGNTTFSLNSGMSETVFLSWNTTSLSPGNYTIMAEAEIAEDKEPADNVSTIKVTLKPVHDVAVVKVEVPSQAFAGTLVTINVTVANEGHYEENVNLTVSYGREVLQPPYWLEYGTINTTTFMLAQRPTSKTVPVVWNTTGVDIMYTYIINATAIIPLDIDLKSNKTDNKNATQTIKLKLGPDVAIKLILAPAQVFIGDVATIEVKVETTENATAEVKVTYDTNINIGTPQRVSLSLGKLTSVFFYWNTTNLNPGEYTLTAEAILDGDPKPKNNIVSGNIIDVKSPIGTIAGTVVDASTGDPIEGATITANGYSVTTDTEGQYTIQLLHETYTVTASATKYHSQSKPATVTAETTTTLNFTLTPINGTISGTVTDSSTGNPIAGATVTANGISVSTGADGTYTIEVPPGTYNVTVSADGYKDSSKTNIAVGAEEAKIVDFELKPIQPLNILLYAGVAAVAIIVIAGIGVYFLKFRKPT